MSVLKRVIPVVLSIVVAHIGATFPMESFSRLPMLPMQVKRAELTRPQAWVPTELQMVLPRASGAADIEKVAARVADVKLALPPYYEAVAVVIEPRSGRTYFTRAGQNFYVVDGGDLFACNSDGGIFQWTRSYFSRDTLSGDLEVAIARFVEEVDDAALAKMAQSTVQIDIRKGAPLQFFTHGSTESSQPGRLTMTGVGMADGVLRLELLSDGGRYRGEFWMDLAARRLLRSVVDGKEFFRAK